MLPNPAPIQEPVTGNNGITTRVWAQWFDLLRRRLNQAPTYLVAQLPATVNAGELAFVPNEVGGSVLAFFDGTNWRRCTDRAIVS